MLQHPSPTLLLEYLDRLKGWGGAESAGLLMHLEPAQRDNLMLLGDCRDIPELSNLDTAWHLVSKRERAQSGCTVTQRVPSVDDEVLLLRLGFSGILERPSGRRRTINERRSSPDVELAPECDGALWIGLRGCLNPAAVAKALQGAADPENGSRGEVPDVASPLTAKLIWNVYHLTTALKDPVSSLPGRMEFQVFLERALSAARAARQPLSLLLLNPDDFSMINHRYGRAQGDRAISEVAHALMDCLRETDGVYRHGGAVFGAVLPATSMEQCVSAAEKTRRHLTTRRYVGGNEQLTFSVGAVTVNADDLCRDGVKADELLELADRALNRARLSGGGRVIVGGLREAIPDEVEAPPLNGIFTTDTEKDYRNMLLLWETVGMISGNTEPAELAAGFVDRLALAFQPDRIVLLAPSEHGALEALATNVIEPAADRGRVAGRAVDLDPDQRLLLEKALQSRQLAQLERGEGDGSQGLRACAVPLFAHGQTVGCLYMDGKGRRLALDTSDVSFLAALGSQLAVALDRSILAARWIREKDRESRALRKELNGLRLNREHGRMVFCSPQMHELMDTVKQVAPSEATVLITGESGTGKEMLAQALHDLSDRSDGPLVVFDCGAVAHSLLEAELFGHVRGAFTGAERASPGRVVQADGGTLFLDEIGELPLEMQSKLLRFVQEKEIHPVGGAASRRVNVRLVAATNRQLQDEVAGGRFRADLYYRLQVISLQAPALRHRPDDILPLAQHFLDRFSTQHGRRLAFTDEALALLLGHDWPGNVRELENCVLRAVLTCGADLIDARHIEFAEAADERRSAPGAVATPLAVASSRPDASGPAPDPQLQLPGNGSGAAGSSPWEQLRAALAEQVRLALEQNLSRPVPLGRWLNDDLVLAAGELSGGVSSRAAKMVGIPESTYRRQFRKASAEAEAGIAGRTRAWSEMTALIRRAVESANDRGDLLDQARLCLLKDVVDQRVSLTVGAALMGVSTPTFKRWIARGGWDQ